MKIEIITHESWDALYYLEEYLTEERPTYSWKIERRHHHYLHSVLYCTGIVGMSGVTENDIGLQELYDINTISKAFLAGFEKHKTIDTQEFLSQSQ